MFTAICLSTASLCSSAICLNNKPVLCFAVIPSLNGNAIESIIISLICKKHLYRTPSARRTKICRHFRVHITLVISFGFINFIFKVELFVYVLFFIFYYALNVSLVHRIGTVSTLPYISISCHILILITFIYSFSRISTFTQSIHTCFGHPLLL